jgi:outer membrane protein OmpA-like peptidoglycan-associated protein
MSSCQDVNADGACDKPETGTEIVAGGGTKAAALADLARARNDYEAANAAMLALVNSGRPVDDDRVSQDKIATALNQITASCNAIAGSEVITVASPMTALDDCLKAQGLPGLSPSWQDTLAKVLANLKMMVDDYNAYAQSTAPFDKDGLQKAIGNYCTANGLGELKSCLATAGLLLADQSVTTTTMEQLPNGTTPANAAPLLDSAKGNTGGATTIPAGAATATPTPTTTLTTLTTVGVPKTDAEAQANLPKVTLPATFEPGKTMDTSAVSFTPPKSRPADTKGGGQSGAGAGPGGTSINLSATITPDGGFVFQLGAQIVISNPEQERNRVFDPKKDKIGYEKLAGGRTRETVTRADGTRVITIRGAGGEVDQRQVVRPTGKSFTLAAGTGRGPGSKAGGQWRDPGDELPPLRLTIPARDYVLDADDADEGDLAFFLIQPPVERVNRIYTIDEVKHSARIRDSLRRLEIGALTFDSGRSTIGGDQIRSLKKLADAMLELLDHDPAETFLIEGHTDAVGDELFNLALSDARANSIASILTEYFDVPPENLATQGYGEAYLKVRTEAAERLNRRVTVRRITPLITVTSGD